MVTFFKQSLWILHKMFVLISSRSSSKLGHLVSKTRSPGQISRKLCYNHFDQNVALISSRSGSQSAMLLRWALQGHHGPLVHISAQNIDCGYSLEPPRRGSSNEYPQSMFLRRNKKNNVYPCKPQWGLRGSKLYRYVFVMFRKWPLSLLSRWSEMRWSCSKL